MNAELGPTRQLPRSLRAELALAFGLTAALAWAAIVVARLPGTVAVVWLANGAVMALVVTAASERALPLLAAAAAGNLAGNLLYGDPLTLSLAFLPPNVAEMAAGVYLIRRTGAVERFLGHQRAFVQVIAAGVLLPPLLGATLGAATLQWLGFAPFTRVWTDWYIGDMLGALASLPLGLALRGGGGMASLRRLVQPAALSVLAAVALGTTVAFEWLPYPFVAVVVGLVAVAFVRPRLEAFAGVAVAVIVFTVLIATGHFTVENSPRAHAFVFAAATLCVLPPLVVAVVVSRQRTLSRTLSAVGSRVDDIVVYADLDGVLIWANEAREIYWGVPNSEVIGRAGHEVMPAAYWNEVLQPLVAQAAMGSVVRRRAEVDFPGRGRRTMELSIQPAHDEEGVRVGVLLCSTDITEIEASHKELERTAQALQASHDQLEQFVRIASHDMREPLNTIVQFCSLIEQHGTERLDPAVALYFAQVRGGASRMKQMLDDVLQFVRLEQEPPRPAGEVDLDALLQEVLQGLHALIAQSRARIEPGALGVVRGHRSLLAVLLQNLLTNAMKFVPGERVPEVRVQMRREGGALRLEVLDNGIGIEANRLAELGVPFRRLNARRKYEGTGLGLSICKRIAEQHGGTLEITSRPGEGSCFALVVPEAGRPLPTAA